MRIAFLGLGLIGGSIARALRAADPATQIVAWTPGGRGPGAALDAGAIDSLAPSVAVAIGGADLVVLAAPPLDCIRLLGELSACEATITDVASTKAAIVEQGDGLGLHFVGGHPMAGRETIGFESASADLFVDRPWVVVSGRWARPVDVERVEWLARAVGARPIRMDGLAHDAAVAGISHLPLVLAAALVEAVAGAPGAPADGWAEARLLAASGWRDMTRLARGDVAMGTGIAVSNAGALADRIRALRAVLDGWLRDLEADGTGPDPAALEQRLADARAVLESAASVTADRPEASTA
ncbi:MAG: prephenate dehydrogenase/arogenate dehydrogenase family protein [Chloroflexi bacterium]|nr:prephenate dehydrogenase/arogenate dehydrogenase family protein [Chloroflexota bacterium]